MKKFKSRKRRKRLYDEKYDTLQSLNEWNRIQYIFLRCYFGIYLAELTIELSLKPKK